MSKLNGDVFRIGIAVVLSSAMFEPCNAQQMTAGRFVGDVNTGCRAWNPHPQPDETASWQGPCVNGFAHGVGKLQWLNKGKPYETDEGDWSEEFQVGKGVQDWGTGRYEGEISRGEPAGRGVLQLRTARYAGEFLNGKPEGKGTITGLSGTFTGTWKAGCLIDGKTKFAFGVSTSMCR